jgi:hypoxanthine phosphoribosyltransferase
MSISLEQAERVRSESICLYTNEQVEQAIERLASEISARFRGKNPLIICVMNGGLILTGKLVTRLDIPLQIDYLHATRYRGETTGGQMHWLARPQHSLKDRYVVVVDDILDEGVTLREIISYCQEQGAKEVASCVLVDKEHDRKQGYSKADFTGLTVEDKYVFGYGMDYKGFLRNAPGIFAVRNKADY